MAKLPTRVLATIATLAISSGLVAVSTSAPAAAAPLPAPYAANAHADLVSLTANVAGLGSFANAKIGHSRAAVDSTLPAGNSTAESANLEGSVLFGSAPVPVDTESASAPPSTDPPARQLASVPLAPVVTGGAIRGDVAAAYTDGSTCVPAVDGRRVLSDSVTDLDGLALAGVSDFGALATIDDSQMHTTTSLVDDAVGGSDVVSTATTSVGDINLLGDNVQVDVSSPVTLRASSDGTTGTAGFVNQPTIVVRVAGVPEPIDIPLNGEPQDIVIPDQPIARVTITGFDATDTSSGATGSGTLQSLLRIQVAILPVIVEPLATVDLSLVPMSVSATAPSGGVECVVPDTTAPAAPVITSPAEDSSTTDTTPTVTGTAEPGSTVTVTENGTVVCTGVADAAGNWSCTPAAPLAPGPHTLGATATDGAGNVSPADSVTFTIVGPDNPDRDGDGLSNQDEAKARTNPDDPDTDDDGLTDGQEVDSDGTGPDQGIGTEPLKADTDGDGLGDGREVKSTTTDPLDPDTDNDGLLDGPEVDAMTIKERFEVCGKKSTKSIRVTTDPLNKDTDRDGLTDGLEVKGYKIKQVVFVSRSGDKVLVGKTRSNPTKADTDKDGIKDKAEKTGSANKKWRRHKSDPTKCDTDQGGVSDGREVKLGSDPSQIKSGPNDLESRGRAARRGSTAVG